MEFWFRQGDRQYQLQTQTIREDVWKGKDKKGAKCERSEKNNHAMILVEEKGLFSTLAGNFSQCNNFENAVSDIFVEGFQDGKSGGYPRQTTSATNVIVTRTV